MKSFAITCMAIILVICAASIQAVDGELDPSFGLNGKLVIPFDRGGNNWDLALAGAVSRDEKIYLAGYVRSGPQSFGLGVARLHRNGSLDESFGQSGKLTYPTLPFPNFYVNGVAMQQDGRLLLSGRTTLTSDFIVCRIGKEGEIDETFGPPSTPGCARAEFSMNHEFFFSEDLNILLQRDEKIVLAGFTYGGGTCPACVRLPALARFTKDGALDPTFGQDGKVDLNDAWTANHVPADIAQTTDNKLVITGSIYSQETSSFGADSFVARLNSDGSFDDSFNMKGYAKIGFDLEPNTSLDQATSIVVTEDRSIIIGVNASHDARRIGIAKFSESGQLDSTFANGLGKRLLDVDEIAFVDDIFVQADGKLVLGGRAGYEYDFSATRLLANGELDPSFGSNGSTSIAFDLYEGNSEDAARVVLSHNGHILMVGHAETEPLPDTNFGYDFAVAQLYNDLIFADDYD